MKRVFASCLSIVSFITLIVVIVLWIVALIIDGPGDSHSCVVVWPLMTAVLVVAFLYLLLRCSVYCYFKKCLNEGSLMRDSSSMQRQKSYDQQEEQYILRVRHPCIALSYGILLCALIFIMIA